MAESCDARFPSSQDVLVLVRVTTNVVCDGRWSGVTRISSGGVRDTLLWLPFRAANAEILPKGGKASAGSPWDRIVLYLFLSSMVGSVISVRDTGYIVTFPFPGQKGACLELGVCPGTTTTTTTTIHQQHYPSKHSKDFNSSSHQSIPIDWKHFRSIQMPPVPC